jgi:hypothetical protein
MTARSTGGRPAGWPGCYPPRRWNLRPRSVQGLEAYGYRFPTVGSPAALPVQTLEERHARSSDGRKTGTGALPTTGRAIQDVLPLHRCSVTLEPGSNMLKEPRPAFALRYVAP